MKSLKIVFATLALAIGFAAPVVRAQDASAPAKHAAKGGDRSQELAEKLGLNDDQKGQVKAIHQDEAKQMKALPNDDTKREKSAAIHKDTQTKIRAILTPDQQAKFDEMNKKPAAKGGDKKADKKAKAPKGGNNNE